MRLSGEGTICFKLLTVCSLCIDYTIFADDAINDSWGANDQAITIN